MAIKFVHKGDLSKTTKFLMRVKNLKIEDILRHYGELGVQELARATPIDTGLTAQSWEYDIQRTKDGWAIYWSNTNTSQNIPIVIFIQYGHGTGTGGYVPPNDFINPAIQPIFDSIAEAAWKEVISI